MLLDFQGPSNMVDRLAVSPDVNNIMSAAIADALGVNASVVVITKVSFETSPAKRRLEGRRLGGLKVLVEYALLVPTEETMQTVAAVPDSRAFRSALTSLLADTGLSGIAIEVVHSSIDGAGEPAAMLTDPLTRPDSDLINAAGGTLGVIGGILALVLCLVAGPCVVRACRGLSTKRPATPYTPSSPAGRPEAGGAASPPAGGGDADDGEPPPHVAITIDSPSARKALDDTPPPARAAGGMPAGPAGPQHSDLLARALVAEVEARREAGGFAGATHVCQEFDDSPIPTERCPTQVHSDHASLDERARLLRRVGSSLRAEGDVPAALAVLAEAVDIRSWFATLETGEGVTLLQELALTKRAGGDIAGALQALSDALSASRMVADFPAGEAVQLLWQSAVWKLDSGDDVGAVEHLLKASQVLEAASDVISVDYLRVLTALAAAHRGAGAVAASLEVCRAAMDVCQRLQAERSEEGVELLLTLGASQTNSGAVADALGTFELARRILEDSGQKSSIQGAVLWMHIGTACGAELDLCRHAAYLARSAVPAAAATPSPSGEGPELAKLVWLLASLGEAECTAGSPDAGAAAFGEAVAARRRAGTLGTAAGARLLGRWGALLAQLGERGAALDVLREARRCHEEHGTLASSAGISVLTATGAVHTFLGDYELAFAVYAEARELWERSGRPPSLEGAGALAGMAAARTRMGAADTTPHFGAAEDSEAASDSSPTTLIRL